MTKEPPIITRDDLAEALGNNAQGGTLFVDSVLENASTVAQIAAEFGMSVVAHQGEPKEAQVDALAGIIRDSDHRAVIAIGGGAVMDAAKAATSIAADEPGAAHYQLGANSMPEAKAQLICVPSTSGTGSEVTRVSIVGDNQGNKKWMYGDALWPTHVLLMPELIHSVPPAIKVYCGLDAMVHALEAASGKNSDAEVVARAARSIPVILDTLADSVAGDPDADQQMQVASLEAGRAIDLGGTTIGHCLGHALGTVCGVPHGLAVALAVQATLDVNVRETPQAFAAIESAVGRGSMLDAWLALIERLSAYPLSFDAKGKSAQDIVQSALADENQPMRNTNVHWFDDEALGHACERVLDYSLT